MIFKCTITPKILSLVVELTQEVARFGSSVDLRPEPTLRKSARAKSLHGTAAIEGNTLTLGNVQSLLEGRSVTSFHEREVLEVRNAALAYEAAGKFQPFSTKDLLKAHKLMMKDLVTDPGKFRSGQVGIWQDGKVRHVAPLAKRVASLVEGLFEALQKDQTLPMLVKAAIVHYELEFIHPFSDGNGRIGRFWQHVLLVRVSALFEYCPVESIIYARQIEYYKALRAADRAADAAVFVEFVLDALLVALRDTLLHIKPAKNDARTRIEKARGIFGTTSFSRKQYMNLHPFLSTATASRDLAKGVAERVLALVGDKASARYTFLEDRAES